MTNRAFWTQGEVQAGRVLPRPQSVDLEHAQVVFWPPSVLEARLRVGWLPEEDHIRWQIELVDPTCSELLAMSSIPARRISEVGYWPTEIERTVERLLPPIINPDPF